ncbi:LysM peptidoglycan-binding domain-containing protein [Bacteroidetes bacterium endosymbiont of Geopemphigus sp.]|uniref:LysM peptidoglycan-binding domain-containing protein n=1 Tax=Bacteroidetes bacterium endosymbiont of Geopemphigus sp. TaxID=2047937 RepID=UPI000CD305D7|nr:LysM peptidoglycan-binding domain-containing protein [Bacteroidetes bacterium endosymbiont of Geopemphigus sp.]
MKNTKNVLLTSIFFLCSLVYAQTTHKVQEGDTLYGLNKQYNLSIEEITRLNPQIIGNSIQLGDIIRLTDSKISVYEVQPKETIYSLSRRFRVSQETLLLLNPEIRNGLKTGILLRIPSSDGEISQPVKSAHQEVLKILPKELVRSVTAYPEDGFIRYSVKEGDTLFTIVRTYKLNLSKLLQNNSELTYGLKAGMILKIPMSSGNKDIRLEDNTKKMSLTENLNIVMLLPLYEKTPEKNQELSQHAADFYSGAKYAIDLLSLRKSIHVKLFDTENNKKKVENFLNAYDFSQVHAVIGPFFRSSVEQVAQALQKQRIPVISPLASSESLDTYPNVIQAEVRDQFLADPIIEEIKNSSLKTQTIYLLSTSQEEVTTTYLRDQLLKWRPQLQILSVDKLSKVPLDASPFIAILICDKPDMGKAFIEGIRRFRPEQLFPLGVGYNPVYYNNLTWLKNYGIVFTMKYHVNKHTETDRKVLETLGFNDKKMPDKYKLLGFDVAYDILERLTENKKILRSMDTKPRSRVANKFQYEKIYGGGYTNKGVWIVRFKSSLKSSENEPSE